MQSSKEPGIKTVKIKSRKRIECKEILMEGRVKGKQCLHIKPLPFTGINTIIIRELV